MEIVQEIGAYAGFAAVVGLAVLSALYFSQARDVRRLREWAGRAPERTAEHQARVQAATGAVSQAQPVARPAPAAGAAAAATSEAPAAAPAAASAEGGGTATATAPPRIAAPPPPTGPPPRIPSAPTTVLPSAQRVKRERWHRRVHWPAPRYLVLLVAGVLIVGGGAAYGVSEYLSEEPASPAAGGGSGAAEEENGPGRRSKSAPINPTTVTVAVLNGTTVPGLAAQIGDRLERAGFQRGNVANATEQQRAESAVLYANGEARAARAVARRLDISQIEPVDPESQALAGDATVIVIVGQDQTR